MAHFPSIDSPCPYSDNLSAILQGDHCRMCKRDVFELTGMSNQERESFLQACSGEVCVRYTVKKPSMLAATALAVAALSVPMAAAAQDAPAGDTVETVLQEEYEEPIIVGGIKDPKSKTLGEEKSDKTMADLPVEYEDEEPAAKQG